MELHAIIYYTLAMRTFVMGDIHGAYRALEQCLSRSDFDDDHDRLIVLGDLCDRGNEVPLVFERLLAIRHLDLIIGNHDLWALSWAETGAAPGIWTSQGGSDTIRSYGGKRMPEAHADLLRRGLPYLVVPDNRLFVHGGYDTSVPIDRQDIDQLVWDRSLLQQAWNYEHRGIQHVFGGYTKIYIGHTPTQIFDSDKPLALCNVVAMDTGAGFRGRLSMMEIYEAKLIQSDPVGELYS
jgi:serine/threonine protein phosphatase 1